MKKIDKPVQTHVKKFSEFARGSTTRFLKDLYFYGWFIGKVMKVHDGGFFYYDGEKTVPNCMKERVHHWSTSGEIFMRTPPCHHVYNDPY